MRLNFEIFVRDNIFLFQVLSATHKEALTMNLEYLDRDLNMKPDALLKESIETFLKRRLKIIESELFLLAKIYGVGNVFEFDRMVREGTLHEDDAFEDYFKLLRLSSVIS